MEKASTKSPYTSHMSVMSWLDIYDVVWMYYKDWIVLLQELLLRVPWLQSGGVQLYEDVILQQGFIATLKYTIDDGNVTISLHYHASK